MRKPPWAGNRKAKRQAIAFVFTHCRFSIESTDRQIGDSSQSFLHSSSSPVTSFVESEIKCGAWNTFRLRVFGKMGWSHPDVSLDDMVKLIKGFVDILILASGYQSSGHFALWDPQNIKRAFQWGLFFDNVNMPISFCVVVTADGFMQLSSSITKGVAFLFF